MVISSGWKIYYILNFVVCKTNDLRQLKAVGYLIFCLFPELKITLYFDVVVFNNTRSDKMHAVTQSRGSRVLEGRENCCSDN